MIPQFNRGCHRLLKHLWRGGDTFNVEIVDYH